MSRRLQLSWILMALVLAGALFLGTRSGTGPHTSQERVYAVADTIKCPRCSGQTVAESDIAIAREIRGVIAQGVDDGRTNDEIRADIAASYGDQYLLEPRASGLVGLVWLIPIVVGIAAVAGLGFVLWRWRGQRVSDTAVTDDDRALVDAARQASHR